MKGGLGLLFSFALLLPLGLGAQPAEHANQLRFAAGVNAMFAGQYDDAARIFESLYKVTQSPRVKLEWARAAFLARQFELAKKLFQEVQQENIPDAVRFNISLFLSEIDKLTSNTDYGFTFVRDTNPFVVSSAQTINIFGLPFDYTPPAPEQTLNGMRIFVSNSSTLTNSGKLRLITELDATKYEGHKNDRSALKLGLQYWPELGNLSYRFGVDHYQQRSELLLRQSYVSAMYRMNQLIGFLNHYELEIRLSQNEYPDFPEVNGQTRSVNFAARKNVTQTIQATAGGYYDITSAALRSQAHETIAMNIGVRFFTESFGSALQLNYVKTARRFKDIDGLFGVRRADDREFLGAVIQPYKLRFQGLYPSLELGTERNRSNIPISAFRKVVFNLGLRKNF